ncbi:MAG: hypothetical protein PHW52_05405, partial [Candidatus Pacebacteria bacterium]|nr:hypothetical protein [Candidatus Paceibacterota bacterium]
PSTAALSTSYISGCGTLSNMASPANLTFPTVAYNSIILNWTPGTGSTKTYIVRKQGSIPTNKDDGTVVYNDNGNAFIDTGLTDNTQYCYALYGTDGTEYTEPLTGCQTTTYPLGGYNSLLFAVSNMKGTGNGDKEIATSYATIPAEYIEVSGDTVYSSNPIIGNSTPDSRMLVVRYDGDLTIGPGVTLTPQVRKRGIVIYVDGDLTINGTISMTARGAANVTGNRLLIASNAGSSYEVPAVGGAGGAASSNHAIGSSGISISDGGTGGGGGGGSANSGTGGAGGAGTSYSGGTGGGGGNVSQRGGDGSSNGGVGGAGNGGANGGGTGNPGGTVSSNSGTGGLLIIYVAGNLNGNGNIVSEGTNSYGIPWNSAVVGGGASGGGSINLFYKGNNNSTINFSAKGGIGGRYYLNYPTNGWYHQGGPGGSGTVRVRKISDEETVNGVCGIASYILSTTQPINNLCDIGQSSSASPDSYAKLLIHGDGADNGTVFNDQTGKTMTVSGNTKTITSVKKFGTSSIYFDGSGDYLTIPDSEDWNFGSGDFTIDFWVYQTSDKDQRYLTQSTAGATSYWQAYYNSGSIIGFSPIPGFTVSTSASNLTLNQWNHLAFVRNGSGMIIFINGVERGRASGSGSFPNIANPLRIGTFIDYNANYDFQGYMDEIRISKGIARWTSDFTPPKAYYYWNWNCNGLNGGSNASCGVDRY